MTLGLCQMKFLTYLTWQTLKSVLSTLRNTDKHREIRYQQEFWCLRANLYWYMQTIPYSYLEWPTVLHYVHRQLFSLRVPILVHEKSQFLDVSKFFPMLKLKFNWARKLKLSNLIIVHTMVGKTDKVNKVRSPSLSS